jgi:hypothetical protein
MTNFATELERIEKGCGKNRKIIYRGQIPYCNKQYLCKQCERVKQQLLTDRKMCEDVLIELEIIDEEGIIITNWIRKKLGITQEAKE